MLPDEKSAEFAKKILRQEHSQPFMLSLGLMKPHTPYYVPKEYYERFPLEDIVLSEILENDLDDTAGDLAFQKGTTAYNRQLKWILEGYGGDLGWKKFMQAYLASIAFADDQVGKVLKALRENGYPDNTIVVLTSDHGYHTGQKNRWFKQTLWERGTRVSLLIKSLGYAAGKCPNPVSLIDIYPTLNDLANLPLQPNGANGPRIEGYSLKPFLKDPETGRWDGPEVALTTASLDTFHERNFTVRSLKYRYIFTHSGQEELYDLEKDPNEWSNKANDPNYSELKKQ